MPNPRFITLTLFIIVLLLVGVATYTFWGTSADGAPTIQTRTGEQIEKLPWKTETHNQPQMGLTPPTVVYQSPFRLFQFITELPSVSVTFSEPVTGVTAGDLTVNGSPASSVTGSGEGPYVFTNYAPPALGEVMVSIAPGNIQDLSGEALLADSWTHTLIDPAGDADGDGVNDGEEVNTHLTNPTTSDTDSDQLPDGFEINNACLEPLLDQAHPLDMEGNPLPGNNDADNDGLTDLEEFQQGTDPCSHHSY